MTGPASSTRTCRPSSTLSPPEDTVSATDEHLIRLATDRARSTLTYAELCRELGRSGSGATPSPTTREPASTRRTTTNPSVLRARPGDF